MKHHSTLVAAFNLLASLIGLAVFLVIVSGNAEKGLGPISFTNPLTWLIASIAAWCICMILTALASRAAVRRNAPEYGLTLVLAASSIVVAWLFKPESVLTLTLFLLTCLHMFFAWGRIRALAGVALTGAAQALVYFLGGFIISSGVVIIISLTISAFGWWFKVELEEWERHLALYDQARKAASEFVSINVRMQDSIDRTSSTTRLRERSRIAREIHDSVGYVLTAVLVQLQAAQEVLRVNPPLLMERLRQLEDMVRESIQEVRREVSELRDESVLVRVGTSRWTRLCEAFADGTGIRVNTVMSDALESINQEISEAVYRIIQEALTNAYRHGGADYIDVSMDWEKQNRRILLRISDNGKGAASVSPGNGLGGMRERLSALGGRMVWQTLPGRGFDIGIEIPWSGDEAS